MITLDAIRQKYPQYSDLSNQELADKLYNKYYADMPRGDFYSKIGLTSGQPQSQDKAESSQEKKPVLDIGNQGLVGRLTSDVLAGAAEGGQAIHNLPYAAVKGLSQLGIVSPSATKYVPQPTNIDFANTFGAKQNLPEKLLRGAISYAPEAMIGGASIPLEAAMGATYGASQNLQSPLAGAAVGGALGAGGAAVPQVGSLVKYLKPQKYLDESIGKLGGSSDVNEITQSLASDIKKSGENIKKQYKGMIDPIREKTEGVNLYQSEAGITPNTYKDLAEKYKDLDLGDAQKMHETFLEKPTFENAHELQSQLGTEARKIIPTDRASSADKRKINELRSAVKTDLNNFLQNTDPSGALSKQYKDASDFYLNEYIPYKNIKPISDVLRQKGVSSTSLLGAFKNPKFVSGEENIPDALKIANDLGEQGKNKIMALELAKKKSLTPKKALSAYDNLETTGLSEYVTPSLENIMKELNTRTKANDIAKSIAKKGAKWTAALTGLEFVGHKIRNLGGE